MVASLNARLESNKKEEKREEREFFIVKLLARIRLIIETILGDRPCAMGV
jgi:hypothetical protein